MNYPPQYPVPMGQHGIPQGEQFYYGRNWRIRGTNNDPVNADSMYVQSDLNPFALDYIPARRGSEYEFRPLNNVPGTSPIVMLPGGEIRTTVAVGNQAGGGYMLDSGSLMEPSFFTVGLKAFEVLQRVGDPPPTKEEILGAREIQWQNIRENQNGPQARSSQSSVLKAQIIWAEVKGHRRAMVLDIGDGVDVFIGPAVAVFVDVLVPLLATTPEDRDANYFNPDGSPQFRSYTYVEASAVCGVAAPFRSEACFTQAVFLTLEGTSLSIPAEAKSVSISTTSSAETIGRWNGGDPRTTPAAVDLPVGNFSVQPNTVQTIAVPDGVAKSLMIANSDGGVATVKWCMKR